MVSKKRSSNDRQNAEATRSATEKEVVLDQQVLDTVAVDDTDDSFDAEDEAVFLEDSDETDDRPQAVTESHGTGLQGKPIDRAGRYSRRSDNHFDDNSSPILTGGDIDANYEDASTVGDEAVGGTVATPDQDIVDDLAAAVGVELDDRTDVRINDLLEERDDRRWELDPESAEDYQNQK
jgi:hypothetical protein